MPYRRKTLRQMPPLTRKLAKLIVELDSLQNRLRHILPAVEEAERMATAERNRETYLGKKGVQHDTPTP